MALFVSRGKSMKIEMHAESKTYPIYLERGILKKAKEYIGRSGKVFASAGIGCRKNRGFERCTCSGSASALPEKPS